MKCTKCGGEWDAPEGFEKAVKCLFCGDTESLVEQPYVEDEEYYGLRKAEVEQESMDPLISDFDSDSELAPLSNGGTQEEFLHLHQVQETTSSDLTPPSKAETKSNLSESYENSHTADSNSSLPLNPSLSSVSSLSSLSSTHSLSSDSSFSSNSSLSLNSTVAINISPIAPIDKRSIKGQYLNQVQKTKITHSDLYSVFTFALDFNLGPLSKDKTKILSVNPTLKPLALSYANPIFPIMPGDFKEAPETIEIEEPTIDESLTAYIKEQLGITIELVLCPAGSFIAGSPTNELGRWNDEIEHKVNITNDFYIGKFAVTQKEYCAITKLLNPSFYNGENNPVENVDWEEAKNYCNMLNNATMAVRPKEYRFDLPTDAQWEYACKAGTKTALNSGKNITSEDGICENLDEVAWYRGNSEDKTHPVGQKLPNKWGIYDMHGNVWEWCRDLANKSKTNEEQTDPVGEIFSDKHTCRGGSWNALPRYCRSAVRFACTAEDTMSELIGFRVALVKVN